MFWDANLRHPTVDVNKYSPCTSVARYIPLDVTHPCFLWRWPRGTVVHPDKRAWREACTTLMSLLDAGNQEQSPAAIVLVTPDANAASMKTDYVGSPKGEGGGGCQVRGREL